MPRRSKNHVDEPLEAPGFQISVRDAMAGKALAYKEGVRPSPYGDVSLEIGNPFYAIGSRLTTGRKYNKGYEKKLPRTKEFNYPRKNMRPGEFPQSIPMKNGRCSNFDTYFDPNENPIPIMLDILDAQRASYVEDEKSRRAIARAEAIPDFDKTPDFIYLQSREDESINQYFADLSESFNQDRINKLLARGFTEEEVASFIDKERERDIEKAVKNPDNPELLMRAALARTMKDRKVAYTHPTGTNAAGIGSRSDAQSIHTVGMAIKSPAARAKEQRNAAAIETLREALRTGQVGSFGRDTPVSGASAGYGSIERGRLTASERVLESIGAKPSAPSTVVSEPKSYKSTPRAKSVPASVRLASAESGEFVPSPDSTPGGGGGGAAPSPKKIVLRIPAPKKKA